MAYSTINDPSAYFHTELYSGNGSTQVITNTALGDFKPDWLWTKSRNDSFDHITRDSSRGVAKRLITHSTGAEDSNSGTSSFNTDGFTLDSTNTVNKSSDTYVAWQWKANGGSTTTNDASATSVGNQDSVYQANTTSRFSMFTYGPLGSGGQIAHGLGAIPHVILIKSRSGTRDWCMYHHRNTSAPETDFLSINQNVGTQDATVWNDTVPTSTVVSVSGDGKVGTDETYIGYAFREVQGYSKFGSYTGNGNADGPFIYTGFKPHWVLIKETGATRNWAVADSDMQATGNGSNTNAFQTNTNAAQDANERMDWLSNGFKIRTTSTTWNTSGGNFIYMAFADKTLVGTNNVISLAR